MCQRKDPPTDVAHQMKTPRRSPYLRFSGLQHKKRGPLISLHHDVLPRREIHGSHDIHAGVQVHRGQLSEEEVISKRQNQELS